MRPSTIANWVNKSADGSRECELDPENETVG
jgi:hypothetical protein